MLHAQNMDDVVCRDLGFECKADYPMLADWAKMVERIHDRKGEIQVALVGKYVKLHDSYLSIVESLNHASFELGKNVTIKWVDSDTVNDESAPSIFEDCAGIILPGGFGQRGIEGMICTCRYARTHNMPYFGICLGMQIAVIEFARSVLGYKDANSREFDEVCEHPVIDLMKDQAGVIKGGTMRLGSYPCKVKAGTILERAYKCDFADKEAGGACEENVLLINERHRHRYEFNNDFREEMRAAGLTISGTSPDESLVEAVEVSAGFGAGAGSAAGASACAGSRNVTVSGASAGVGIVAGVCTGNTAGSGSNAGKSAGNGSYFHVGVQFHPEFKSRPNKPSPLFVEFLRACDC